MKLICPSCGAIHSVEAWQNDVAARQCLKLAGEMPGDISSRCFAYLALFRPPARALSWKKVLRLLHEIQTLTKEGHIQWDRRPARPCTQKMWGQGLEKIVENPPQRLPLKTHGYLKSIVYDLADETDRHKEVKRNQTERNGSFSRTQSGGDVGAALSGCPSNPRGGPSDQKPERINFENMKKITANYRKNRLS